MKQLVQNFKNGEIKLENVPAPDLKNGCVLVANAFSLISSGTEKATVQVGQASLLGKAQKRPDLVKQVLQNIKKEGILATFQKVKTKLDFPKTLGYSSCGLVIDSKDYEGKFKQGDRVACAGQDYASHAEVVCVPQNLVTRIPDGVSFQEASFVTIGAIALQGVRQADPKIGEKVCVIGLGLIGQVTFQILKANGCFVCGIDLSGFALESAKQLEIDCAFNRNDKDLYKLMDNFTGGYGFDKVIITSSSSDNDPIILATEILRKKGSITVVGNVKMDIPREPHFYKKELELKIAASCGPGRYDPLYEEAGIDYPYGYVRFTENRNMDVFLELISRGLVKTEPLISYIFDFEQAIAAYDLVLGKKKENFIGILLRYKETKQPFIKKIEVNAKPIKDITIGFLGAGSFAQSYLLPHLKTLDVSFNTVVTTKGITSMNVAEKFGFNYASTDPEEIISNEKINTVFIATRHDSHGKFVREALKKSKNIFVEKPLCLNIEELKDIAKLYNGNSVFMVGFNRRFSPAAMLVKQELAKFNSPIMMNFRVNAGYIPRDHWIQNFNIGGGRLIGEVCHFIDLMLYYSNAKPIRVYAFSIKTDSNKWLSDDNVALNIEFDNGSVGNIIYTALGDNSMGKEKLEVFYEGNSLVVNDFKEVKIFKNGKVKIAKCPGKGYKQEIESFLKSIRTGEGNPIDFNSVLLTTLTTFKIVESLKNNSSVIIGLEEIY